MDTLRTCHDCSRWAKSVRAFQRIGERWSLSSILVSAVSGNYKRQIELPCGLAFQTASKAGCISPKGPEAVSKSVNDRSQWRVFQKLD